MIEPTSVFRESALISGLVSKDQIDQALADLRNARAMSEEPGHPLDERLAKRLVEMNVLTEYQAGQLERGKTKFNLGDYIIAAPIACGGTAQVFQAVHRFLLRDRAVKVLPFDKTTPEAVSRFRDEYRHQARLDHSNIVRIHDAGEDGGAHYLVMEYVPGADLRRLVRSKGALPFREAASIIRKAALGLDHVHQCGLIHRDVRPGKILVTPAGEAKVTCLSRAITLHELQSDSRAGRIVGTADYLSPDQIISPRDVSAVADIYSLGCTLYYAITGKVPYPGGNDANKARRHLTEQPWHPRRFNEQIPEKFVEVIADMMEKDPQKRIATMSEVAARLEPWGKYEDTENARKTLKSEEDGSGD